MADLYKIQYANNTLTYPGWNGYVGYNKDNTIELINKYFPIGTYYTCMSLTFDPNADWVGTWVRDTDGLVLKSDITPDLTGGELEHSITIDEIPAHTHTTRRCIPKNGTATGVRGNDNMTSRADRIASSSNLDIKTGTRTTTSCTNTSNSHNNVQNSLICIRWHRIA